MNMIIKYPRLHLSEWPFRIVPDQSFCTFMGDRTQLKNDIIFLLNSLSLQPASSIHLMWAWFGAGKTHTLKYIDYLCRTKFTGILPIYMEFPRAVKNFIDLYKIFIIRPVINLIDDIYSKIYGESLQEELQLDFPDLSNALKLHVAGTDEQQDIAIRWLRAECRSLKTLANIGVSKPILAAEEALKVTSWIFRLIFEGSRYLINTKNRILWMIDEFQRINDCRTSTKNEINSCLLSIFNRCPNSLSIIISFSGYPEEKSLPSWLSPEIKDRIGIDPPLLLPRLSDEEAYKFVKDVLGHFRDLASKVSIPFFPFSEESVHRVLSLIKEKAKESNRDDQPKPRTIMQFFDRVLKSAHPKLEKDEIKLIDVDFIDLVLKDVILPPEEE